MEAKTPEQAQQPVVEIKTEVRSDVKIETVEETIRRVAKERQFNNADILVRIAICESGLKPNAQNPHSTAHGVFQILQHGNLTIEQREDVEFSTNWAIDHWGNGHPWDSSRHCWDKKNTTL